MAIPRFPSGLRSAASALLAQIATPSSPPSGETAVYAKSDGQLYMLNSSGSEAVIGPEQQTFPWSYAGPLSVRTGALRFYFSEAYQVVTVRASVGTAPTGSSIIVDVNKNGTTLYTTQANRPAIAASGFTAVGATPDVASFAAGDYCTVDIDQVGSTVAGSDLVVAILLRRTT